MTVHAGGRQSAAPLLRDVGVDVVRLDRVELHLAEVRNEVLLDDCEVPGPRRLAPALRVEVALERLGRELLEPKRPRLRQPVSLHVDQPLPQYTFGPPDCPALRLETECLADTPARRVLVAEPEHRASRPHVADDRPAPSEETVTSSNPTFRLQLHADGYKAHDMLATWCCIRRRSRARRNAPRTRPREAPSLCRRIPRRGRSASRSEEPSGLERGRAAACGTATAGMWAATAATNSGNWTAAGCLPPAALTSHQELRGSRVGLSRRTLHVRLDLPLTTTLV